MATCGYLCPSCEGKGYKEDGSDCDWCFVKKPALDPKELDEWVEKVHGGSCCADRPEDEE